MFARFKRFAKDLVQFIQNVANDERIPSRDKKVLLVLAALVISPIDLIPDWIPILGLMDDLVIVAIVLDYLFNILDHNILLAHYPWGMKSFTWLKRTARVVAQLTPDIVKKYVWKYEADPYSSNRKLE